jgi:glycosyltransferase involved in cell wall biosynthesis
MDEVADAASIRRRVVGSVHVDLGALPGGGFDRDLEQMRGAYCGEAAAAFRIGAGDVEIAQHDIVHAVDGSHIVQHDFRHQLGRGVGRGRPGRRMFRHRHLVRIAVDGSRRRKDEAVEDVQRWYPRLTICAFTSRNEGFGLTLIEAMSSGAALAASRAAAAEFVVEDGVTGVLTSPGDVCAGRRIGAPDARCGIGDRSGQARALEKFSLDVEANAIAAVYETLV